MIAACTLFDSKFFVEGWLCWKSIHRFNPDMKFYVLCLDEKTFWEATYFVQQSGNVIPIALEQMENHFSELEGAKLTRPWNAYTQTCKVFLPSYIFDKFGEELLFYVDSDLYFWSDANQVAIEMGDYSFMVTSRELEPPPKQGRFNGGFFSCRNDDHAAEFLNWWQKKTVEWCLWRPGSDGRFAEEGYLNVFYDRPNKFRNIRISSNPGINLANWNFNKHRLETTDDGIVIDGSYPLVCFHYQGMLIHDNRYESYASIKTDAELHIYDTYYREYISFMEELSNGLDSNRWW